MGNIPDTFGEQAAFASRRIVPWHNLGTVFDGNATREEFQIAAHMHNLNERKVSALELASILGIEQLPFVNNQYFIIRDNPFISAIDATDSDTGKAIQILSNVGGRYEVFTTDEILDLAETIVAGAYRYETLGTMANGNSVFASLVHPDDIVLDPNGSNDTIKRYLLLHSTHDGSGNVTAKDTNVRVVCQNTLDVAIQGKGTTYKIRHTKNMRDRLEEAARIMGFAAEYDVAFEKEVNELFNTPMSTAKFWDIVTTMYPEPEKDIKGSKQKWTNRTDRYMETWNGVTGSMDNLPESAWRAVNALTEADQWAPNARAGNAENYYANASGFTAGPTSQRQKVLEVVKAMA
jgi:phage/plasmid-like protein (TIGR03299 family)